MITINNNRKYILWLVTLFMLIPAAASAGVYFATKEDSSSSYEQTRPCFVDYPLYGSCSGNKTPRDFCPTDNRYFRSCGCDTTVYQYDASNCKDNKTLGGKSCDNKYETCNCDTTKYKHDSTNCPAPKVTSGNACGGKSEKCGCPVEYSKTCSSPMIGGEAACDGKYKTCKCPDSYLICDNGGEVGATQCTEESGTVKWSKCKPEACPSGTTDYSGMGSNLNLVVSSSAIQTVGTKKCVPNNYCATLGYGKSCSGEAVKCPLDTSKLYCF